MWTSNWVLNSSKYATPQKLILALFRANTVLGNLHGFYPLNWINLTYRPPYHVRFIISCFHHDSLGNTFFICWITSLADLKLSEICEKKKGLETIGDKCLSGAHLCITEKSVLLICEILCKNVIFEH